MTIRILGLITIGVIAQCGSAMAHPRCDDMGFALVHGQWISSQWCQEELAAQIFSQEPVGLHGCATAQQPRSDGRVLPRQCQHRVHHRVRTLQTLGWRRTAVLKMDREIPEGASPAAPAQRCCALPSSP